MWGLLGVCGLGGWGVWFSTNCRGRELPVCGGGVHHFYHVSWLSLYGHTGVLGLDRSPLARPMVQARGTSLCCPSTSAICTLGQNLACCPRTTWKWGGGSVASAGPAPRYWLH